MDVTELLFILEFSFTFFLKSFLIFGIWTSCFGLNSLSDVGCLYSRFYICGFN